MLDLGSSYIYGKGFSPLAGIPEYTMYRGGLGGFGYGGYGMGGGYNAYSTYPSFSGGLGYGGTAGMGYGGLGGYGNMFGPSLNDWTARTSAYGLGYEFPYYG